MAQNLKIQFPRNLRYLTNKQLQNSRKQRSDHRFIITFHSHSYYIQNHS